MRSPTHPAASTTRVTLDGRSFFVDYDDRNEPIRIKERKVTEGGIKYASYWVGKHHPVGGPSTIPARILAVAALAEKDA
jgi:hypothetical protein